MEIHYDCVNDLSTPIERSRVEDFKNITQLYNVFRKYTLNIMMGRLKGWEKTYHANINQKKAKVAMLESE